MRAVVVPAIQQIEPRHCISKDYKSSDQQRPNTCRDHYILKKKWMVAPILTKQISNKGHYHLRFTKGVVTSVKRTMSMYMCALPLNKARPIAYIESPWCKSWNINIRKTNSWYRGNRNRRTPLRARACASTEWYLHTPFHLKKENKAGSSSSLSKSNQSKPAEATIVFSYAMSMIRDMEYRSITCK